MALRRKARPEQRRLPQSVVDPAGSPHNCRERCPEGTGLCVGGHPNWPGSHMCIELHQWGPDRPGERAG